MRILTLSNCSLRASEGSGGIILALTEGLRDRGHDVDLFGPDDYEVCRWLRPRGNSYRQTLGMWRFATRQLARKAYDILEIYGGEGWMTFKRLRRPGPRPLLVAHSNGLEPHARFWKRMAGENRQRWWQFDQSGLMAEGFRTADGLVVLSDFDRRFALNEAYQSADRVVTVTPGLHPAFLGLPLDLDRQQVIGFSGNWLLRKGIELLRVAIPAVLREFQNARALLVGMGSDFETADWFPEDVHPRIEVVPWVDRRAELIKLYKRMSVALMPSYYESFGLVAAEAMACGAAAIVTPTGFGTMLRDADDALVLPEPNAEHLTSACRRLLTDDGLRRMLAARGHRRVQLLTWKRSLDLLERTYSAWHATHTAQAV